MFKVLPAFACNDEYISGGNTVLVYLSIGDCLIASSNFIMANYMRGLFGLLCTIDILKHCHLMKECTDGITFLRSQLQTSGKCPT